MIFIDVWIDHMTHFDIKKKGRAYSCINMYGNMLSKQKMTDLFGKYSNKRIIILTQFHHINNMRVR